MPLKDLLLVIGKDTEAGERYTLELARTQWGDRDGHLVRSCSQPARFHPLGNAE